MVHAPIAHRHILGQAFDRTIFLKQEPFSLLSFLKQLLNQLVVAKHELPQNQTSTNHILASAADIISHSATASTKY
jgi:hypothetical protein